MVSKTNVVLAFFLAAVLAGLFVQYGPSMTREGFMQAPIGMPLNNAGMGPYDQVNIGAGFSGWAANEPLLNAASPANTSDDSNKLMYLVGNKVSADCCPAAFNTDTGCVCLTGQQMNFMAHRGGNKA
jgi:hypothetical protein